ncbi:MAG: glycerol-3-phosphate dehydrogenase [Pseudomonadota bacterium]
MIRSTELLVIGGGINGAGIARDAAGRGIEVLLCEKDDLAQHTSSASTKLIHGGLRYLEQYEFRLVREALAEREVLLRNARHIIWPLRFVLPHDRGMRPAWLLRLGLFLYDHLGARRELPASSRVDLTAAPHAGVLREGTTFGFEYSDCWVDDARLVVLNALDAANRGAQVMTRTACVGLERQGTGWLATLQPASGSPTFHVHARAVVNAAGPWVTDVLQLSRPTERKHAVRLVKGSHVVVPRLFAGEHCYLFQNRDGRVVFAIPYEGEFTLVGTTDIAYRGERNNLQIDASEVEYICRAASEYFRSAVSPADVVWSYSGVRPLYDDNAQSESAVTREYVLDLQGSKNDAPLLSVFGGKITTYRRLAEHALGKLAPLLENASAPWTAKAPLPGGDLPAASFDEYVTQLAERYPWVPAKMLYRLARLYGTRCVTILGDAHALSDLGVHFGADLYEREVTYLLEHEFAASTDDILWRRTKLGLRAADDALQSTLSEWLLRRRAA